MKILEIDYDYYYYPQDISCIDDFIEYAEGDNLKGHREKISLDGECYGYEKKK